MSAIEVLRQVLQEIKFKTQETTSVKRYYIYLEQQNAISEALLALEQKEEMQMQIKRIEDCINEFETGRYFEENTLEEPSEFFIRDLKKVLDKMKEVLGEL